MWAQSHRHEQALGLVDAGGRFYDPKFGIFLSADPIGPLSGSSSFGNRYAYAGYDPINQIDLNGMNDTPIDGNPDCSRSNSPDCGGLGGLTIGFGDSDGGGSTGETIHDDGDSSGGVDGSLIVAGVVVTVATTAAVVAPIYGLYELGKWLFGSEPAPAPSLHASSSGSGVFAPASAAGSQGSERSLRRLDRNGSFSSSPQSSDGNVLGAIRCGTPQQCRQLADDITMIGLPGGAFGRAGEAAAGKVASIVARFSRWLFGSGRGAANGAVNITEKGLAHVLERHVAGGALAGANKSIFSAGENVAGLIQRASTVTPAVQNSGRLAYTVDAGRVIGVDRATGAGTSIYTVITEAAGDLVTAFPGMP